MHGFYCYITGSNPLVRVVSPFFFSKETESFHFLVVSPLYVPSDEILCNDRNLIVK